MTATPVQVRIQGLDPKGAKAASASFSAARNGLTTLSASGLRVNLPGSDFAVLAPGSLFVPFVQPSKRRSPQGSNYSHLLPSTNITCLSIESPNSAELSSSDLTLYTLLQLPDADQLANQLLSSSNQSSQDATFGWALSQLSEAATSSTSAMLVAVLLPSNQVQPDMTIDSLAQHLSQLVHLLPQSIYRPGLPISLVGSPFGCLAPVHFTNLTIQGILAACLPAAVASHAHTSLSQDADHVIFLVDAHCLPGMEGSPLYSSDGDLLGLLTLPLKRGETEVNVAISINVIAHAIAQLAGQTKNVELPKSSSRLFAPTAASSRRLPSSRPYLAPSMAAHQPASALLEGANAGRSENAGGDGSCSGSGGLDDLHWQENATDAVVLIKAGSSWASGVVASASGIVITSAHLFPSANGPQPGTKSSEPSLTPSPALYPPASPSPSPSLPMPPARRSTQHAAIQQHPSSSHAAPLIDPSAPLLVRVTNRHSSSWHAATVVHIFHGHLDVAVLQLVGNFPALTAVKLWPTPLTSVAEGLPVTVVGHAMFGPSSGMPPLTTAGNLAKVLLVDGKASMVMTSAAVHSGASGGAVFGPNGRLVGLVTSNARHVRGAILPHLNFAIASDELRPLWRLAAQLQGRTEKGKKGEGRAWLKELRGLDAIDPEADRLWTLSSQTETEVAGEDMRKLLEDKIRGLQSVNAIPLDSHEVKGRVLPSKL